MGKGDANIYAPEYLGLQGELSNVRGRPGEGEQTTLQLNDSGQLNDAMLPYREVVGYYSQTARESLERSLIPANMTEIVKDYFSSLEE